MLSNSLRSVTFLALAAASALAVATAAPAPLQRDCLVETDVSVDPTVVRVGDEATVAVSLEADCSGLAVPVRAALVFDNSNEMGGTRMNYMRQAVEAFVDSLDMSTSQVGLATYYHTAQILSPLTHDGAAVVTAAQQFYPRAGSNLTMGIRAGIQMLRSGQGMGQADNVIVILHGSTQTDTPEAALAEAQVAKDQDIHIVTIATGVNSDGQLLEEIATSPALAYSEGTASRFPSLYTTIATDLSRVRLQGAAVTAVLPEELTFVFGSGVPAPRVRGRELTWQYQVWPGRLEIAYGVAASRTGRFPVADSAVAELAFDRGPPVGAGFVVPELEVVADLEPTPTATVLAPTPGATPRIIPAYLPWLANSACRTNRSPLDLVIVVDTSASMLDRVATGGVRLDYAMAGAAALIDSLSRAQGDRVAVVAAGREVRVLSNLTSGHAAAISSLARLYAHTGGDGQLAPGLEAASGMFVDAGRRRYVVAVTDGVTDVEAAALAAGILADRWIPLALLGIGSAATLVSRVAGAELAPDEVTWQARLAGLRPRLDC